MFFAEHIEGGHSALFHAGGGESGEADDVADGGDVWDGGAEVGIDFDATAVVGGEAGGLEVEAGGCALATDAIEEAIGGEDFAGFEGGLGHEGAGLAGVGGGDLGDGDDFFTHAEGAVHLSEVVLERFADFGVDEIEEAVAGFDEGDADSEGGEHGGVFGADDAAADDDHCAGEFFEGEHLIGGDDGGAVEGDVFGFGGGGAGGDEDVVGVDLFDAAGAVDFDDVRVDEGAVAFEDFDLVGDELLACEVDFGADDALGGGGESFEFVFAGEVLVLGEGDDVLHLVDGEDGLAEGLAGDGAGVDGDTTDEVHFFADDDVFAELGGLDGGFLAAGA